MNPFKIREPIKTNYWVDNEKSNIPKINLWRVVNDNKYITILADCKNSRDKNEVCIQAHYIQLKVHFYKSAYFDTKVYFTIVNKDGLKWSNTGYVCRSVEQIEDLLKSLIKNAIEKNLYFIPKITIGGMPFIPFIKVQTI